MTPLSQSGNSHRSRKRKWQKDSQRIEGTSQNIDYLESEKGARVIYSKEFDYKKMKEAKLSIEVTAGKLQQLNDNLASDNEYSQSNEESQDKKGPSEKNSDRDNLQAAINNEEKILDILDSLRTKGISSAQNKAIAQLINLASSTGQIADELRDVARLSGNTELERLHAIERMINNDRV